MYGPTDKDDAIYNMPHTKTTLFPYNFMLLNQFYIPYECAYLCYGSYAYEFGLYLEIISWRFGYRPKYQPETQLSAREL